MLPIRQYRSSANTYYCLLGQLPLDKHCTLGNIEVMATTSLQTNLIIRLDEEDFQALEGIARHIHIPTKDLIHGIISYALYKHTKLRTTIDCLAASPQLQPTIKKI